MKSIFHIFYSKVIATIVRRQHQQDNERQRKFLVFHCATSRQAIRSSWPGLAEDCSVKIMCVFFGFQDHSCFTYIADVCFSDVCTFLGFRSDPVVAGQYLYQLKTVYNHSFTTFDRLDWTKIEIVQMTPNFAHCCFVHLATRACSQIVN